MFNDCGSKMYNKRNDKRETIQCDWRSKNINGLKIVLDDGTIAVRHKCAFNIINYGTNRKDIIIWMI